MRELPRQLDAEELTRLFSGRTRLVEELAHREDPLGVADDVAAALPEEDKVAALSTHPRIGEASAEQHGDVPEELSGLNRAYEAKFGFPFVVFVAGRPRRELVPVLRERLERTREEELAAGLRELVAIARDRWTRT
jgi:OHCU decarboxylase